MPMTLRIRRRHAVAISRSRMGEPSAYTHPDAMSTLAYSCPMKEYILLMHQDAPDTLAADDPERWGNYLAHLRSTGQFDGGSAIGPGERVRKHHPSQAVTGGPSGFIRVRADSLEGAKQFLAGNPVYEAGGTVEVRELPRT